MASDDVPCALVGDDRLDEAPTVEAALERFRLVIADLSWVVVCRR